MTLGYTTLEAIANRLRGRLQVGGPALAFGNTVVDENLIQQVAAQVKGRMDARLKSVYQLPLKNLPNPLVASIQEKLIICELMGTHFVGQEGSEEAGYGRMMCSQGATELKAVLDGEVVLEGEAVGVGSEISANYSLVLPRLPGQAEGLQW
jgi:phage gp36-like protein